MVDIHLVLLETVFKLYKATISSEINLKHKEGFLFLLTSNPIIPIQFRGRENAKIMQGDQEQERKQELMKS